MFKINDYCIFKRDVCKVVEIKEKYIKDLDYYILSPINDLSLKLFVPVNQEETLMRKLKTKEEIEKLLANIANIEPFNGETKNIDAEYKKYLNTGELEDYIRILKTTIIRNEERIKSKRKICETDNNYAEAAQDYLLTEISIVLNKDIEKLKIELEKKLRKLCGI